MRRIDVHDHNCCPATSCQTDKVGTIPGKMPFPPLAPGIEEDADAPRAGITATQVACFRQVAVLARPCEGSWVVGAAMFFRNDVFKVKRKEWQIAFVEQAILATVAGPSADQG